MNNPRPVPDALENALALAWTAEQQAYEHGSADCTDIATTLKNIPPGAWPILPDRLSTSKAIAEASAQEKKLLPLEEIVSMRFALQSGVNVVCPSHLLIRAQIS